MAYSVPDLAYPFDALEPHIDARTMEIHHDKHHAAYVTNLNAALEGTEWMDRPIEAVLAEPRDHPRGQAHRRAQQRRRPREPHALLGDHGAGRRRRAVRRPRRARSPTRSARSTSSRRRSTTPASSASAPAGAGSSGTAPASPCCRRRTRTRPSWTGKTPLLGDRRLGARLLPQLPEPPPGLPRGLVERRRTGTRSRAKFDAARRASPNASARGTRACRAPRPSRAAAHESGEPPRTYSVCECGGCIRSDLPWRCASREHPGRGRRRQERRRADPPGRGGRPAGVRGAPPAVRALGARDRAAADRRPRAGRGRDAGHVHERLAVGRPLRPRARRGDLVDLHRRPQRDHRRPPPHARADGRRRRPSVAAPGPGPDDAAEAEWVAWRVHRALETLPEQERTLIELAYWSGLSQSEIADYVNLPLGTVKTRTRSALRRLADELGGRARRGARMSDVREIVGDDARARRSSRGSSGCTTCSSRSGRRPSSPPRSRARPEPPRARVIPFPRRYRFTAVAAAAVAAAVALRRRVPRRRRPTTVLCGRSR